MDIDTVRSPRGGTISRCRPHREGERPAARAGDGVGAGPPGRV